MFSVRPYISATLGPCFSYLAYKKSQLDDWLWNKFLPHGRFALCLENVPVRILSVFGPHLEQTLLEPLTLFPRAS